MEHKYYNIVRQTLGYARYETEEEVAEMGRMYKRLRRLLSFL